MEKTNFVDFYSLYDLKPTSTFEEIKKKHHILSIKMHSDKQQNADSEIYKLINQGYNIFKEELERKKYNTLYTEMVTNPLKKPSSSIPSPSTSSTSSSSSSIFLSPSSSTFTSLSSPRSSSPSTASSNSRSTSPPKPPTSFTLFSKSSTTNSEVIKEIKEKENEQQTKKRPHSTRKVPEQRRTTILIDTPDNINESIKHPPTKKYKMDKVPIFEPRYPFKVFDFVNVFKNQIQGLIWQIKDSTAIILNLNNEYKTVDINSITFCPLSKNYGAFDHFRNSLKRQDHVILLKDIIENRPYRTFSILLVIKNFVLVKTLDEVPFKIKFVQSKDLILNFYNYFSTSNFKLNIQRRNRRQRPGELPLKFRNNKYFVQVKENSCFEAVVGIAVGTILANYANDALVEYLDIKTETKKMLKRNKFSYKNLEVATAANIYQFINLMAKDEKRQENFVNDELENEILEEDKNSLINNYNLLK